MAPSPRRAPPAAPTGARTRGSQRRGGAVSPCGVTEGVQNAAMRSHPNTAVTTFFLTSWERVRVLRPGHNTGARVKAWCLCIQAETSLSLSGCGFTVFHRTLPLGDPDPGVGASQGMASQILLATSSCHVPQEAGVQNASDDVASNICQAWQMLVAPSYRAIQLMKRGFECVLMTCRVTCATRALGEGPGRPGLPQHPRRQHRGVVVPVETRVQATVSRA